MFGVSPACGGDGFGPPISVPHDLPKIETRQTVARNLIDQTLDEAMRKSRGCLECHKGIDEPTMHAGPNVVLGCTDCHGGNPTPGLTQRKAHVEPRNPVFWQSSANPNDSSVLLNHESPEFIQFVNPGDLRVADRACGLCHKESVNHVWLSMMNHGAMLWGAALYNNGNYPHKNYRFGQAYSANGEPLMLVNPTPVTPEDTRLHGILPYIEPLPRFPISQPGNILRIFEKGGEKQLQLGTPFPNEPPGKPLRRLSERGLGTLNRIDPVFLNLQKTRLHDPLLGFMGSNNHPGDYRSSGCSACHVVYANDRSPTHSGWYSKYGNQGLSFSGDQAILKNERGHPIAHKFTRAIPSSQCMNCHMHQGNLFVNPYLGYTWWDQESDGEFMYPTQQKNPTEDELAASFRLSPEAAAARGLWGDPDFLEKVAELNPKLKETQFADYHGHGWVFRAVFKKDKKGNLLDLADNIIPHDDDTHKFAKAVHLKDIHLANGMQCVDCHFTADVHGNGNLYGEPRAATTIECIDCHGTITQRPRLVTSGNGGEVDLNQSSTPWGPRFVWEGKKLFQRSMMRADLRWEIPQTTDTIDPSSSHYNAKSAYAKTLRRDGKTWGDVPRPPLTPALSPSEGEREKRSQRGSRGDARHDPQSDGKKFPLPLGGGEGQGEGSAVNANCARELAHDNSNISCQICHSSWATSCFGCHLPMRANQRVPLNKFEGITTRNYTTYNPQVVRDDVFQLGIDATYKNHRLAVIRSSSAVVVGSQNANREWVYSQQQTVSAEGYSGQAYNPHFPHTTSSVGTTKNCVDCHLSRDNDNNAWMASLLGFGTGTMNFFGRYAYVGCGKEGVEAVVWTEQAEPQAAIGSHLHKLAYPNNYKQHIEENKGELKEAHHHHGKEILDLTLRGEYLYTANGPDGFEVFDVANIDNKGFSERIVTSPVSPLGQRTYIRTKYATSVTLPSTLGIDPLRQHLPKTEKHAKFGEIYTDNEEQPISLIYAWVFVTDREEGLVMVSVGTLVDGNPDNNFLDKEKVIRFNPDGKLTGAMHSCMAGTNLLVVGKNGLFVLGLRNDALEPPTIVGELRSDEPLTPALSPRERENRSQRGNGTDAPGNAQSGRKLSPLPGGEGQGEGKAADFSPQRLSLKNPRAIAAQWRYAFISDDDGVKVVDITEPTKPRLVPGAMVPLAHAGRLYAARTYLYVANGPEGLAIVDIENPEKPKLDQMFNADGALNDTRAVQSGSVNASMFALVADGKNGLRVVQMISPDTVPGYMGFSPRPNPKLIATFPTKGEAVAVSRGLDRDRVVDETGNQTVVFGRRGSRPFHVDEMESFYRHYAGIYPDEANAPRTGELYRVEDVVLRDRQLATRSGTKLQPSGNFRPEPVPPPVRVRNERLIRRGK
jgi:hypothetical protein